MSVLIDTNVLLYAAEIDQDERKKPVARRLLDRPHCVMAAQSLNEFVYQSTRRSRPHHLALEEALSFVLTLRRFPVVATDLSLIDRAADLARRTRYSWWDSLIVAAAITAGCETLASEDMQHGRVIDGVRIDNPFRELA